MSDKHESNFDLERAEQRVIAAGHPELAGALYDYAQATRNFVQGDFGQSFIDAYESVLVKHVGPLHESEATTARILGQVVQSLDQQRDLVQQILAAHKETARGLKKLQGQMKESQDDRRLLHQEVAAVKDDVAELRQEIEALKQAQGRSGDAER